MCHLPEIYVVYAKRVMRRFWQIGDSNAQAIAVQLLDRRHISLCDDFLNICVCWDFDILDISLHSEMSTCQGHATCASYFKYLGFRVIMLSAGAWSSTPGLPGLLSEHDNLDRAAHRNRQKYSPGCTFQASSSYSARLPPALSSSNSSEGANNSYMLCNLARASHAKLCFRR